MSIRERLKLAYENVAYGADKTWSNEFHALQKLNLDLYTKESQLQQQINIDLRPRTVRDCIPNSKLAKYANYEYNDSRELSYTANDFTQAPSLCFTEEFKSEKNKEPWMLEEVDTYYKWYMNQQSYSYENQLNQTTCKLNSSLYESPFFKINSLSEYLLKLQLSKDTVKKLWDVRNYDSKSFMYRSLQSIKGEKSLVVYKSPGGQFFISEYDDLTKEIKEDYCEWFRDDLEYQNDLDHLNILSNTFKKQTEKNESELVSNPITDHAHQKRLYSAVLQGYSSSKITPQANEGQMTILKRNIKKSEKTNDKLGSISELSKEKVEEEVTKQEYNSNSTVLNKSDCKLFSNSFVTKSVQTTSSVNEVGINSTTFSTANKSNSYSLQHDINTYQNRIYSGTTFLPNITPVIQNQPLAARYRQNFIPNNYHYPSFYMFIQNSFQQQNYVQPSFYNPLLLQRTLPTNYERTIPQRTLHLPVAPQYVVPTSNFISQGQYTQANFQRYDSQVFKPKAKTKIEVLPSKRMRTGSAMTPNNIKKNNDFSSCSSFKTGLMMSSSASSTEPLTANTEIDYLVSRTVDLVLEDGKNEKIVPVSGSLSEELERQALEQYNNSDDVYQELERQAAEEYENSSENCKNPPNCNFLFGGFLNQCRILLCYG